MNLSYREKPNDKDHTNDARAVVSSSSRTIFIIKTHDIPFCHRVANIYQFHGFYQANEDFILLYY